jgi:hypothetical protein
MKVLLLWIFILFFNLLASGQQNILDDESIQKKVEECLFSMYGCNFEKASSIQMEIQEQLPDHPAPYFLKGLITYWEYFPILPEDSEVENFILEMNHAIDLAQDIKKTKAGEMEGIFFDMHARAFKGMFWADNGKIVKVIPDLDNMYSSTMKGIEFKEKFNEYYFSSALYNYYIEAYTDKHPAYKPIIALFRKGNKALGLEELQYAIDSTTYIRYEALLFMSLIQLNYEGNLYAAADYMARLFEYFPENIYYRGQFLISVLHNKNYAKARSLLVGLSSHSNDFHKMIFSLGEGFLQENDQNNNLWAKKQYKNTIAYAEKYGAIANLYASIAYAGLARIATTENDQKAARKYKRMSSQLSVYDFILDY